MEYYYWQYKKIIDKLIIAKDIIVEGSSKILILQKDSFFYHREGFKSGFIFIKRPTHNIVNDLDDEIGVLIKKNVRSILRMVRKYFFLLIADKRKTHCWIGIDIVIES